MKRKFVLLLTIISLIYSVSAAPLSVKASDIPSSTIELLDNGYYFETVIEDEKSPMLSEARATTKYITKTKTTQFKNSSGDVLWSVSIKATFSYDGTTAKCTSCTPSASSFASTWTIKSVTSSKSGNSATAKAVATHTGPSGATQDITKSVTIKCSATGVVS